MLFRYLFAILGLLLPFASFPLLAATPEYDFSTHAGFEKTCSNQPKTHNGLRTDEARIAYVICQDVALVKHAITWGDGLLKNNAVYDDQYIIKALRGEMEYLRKQIATSRQLLEKIKLGNNKSLLLKSGQWQTDLNSDNKIDIWEKYFFAIPKRAVSVVRFSKPSDDLAYYENEYDLAASFKIDQSDILWAISYHYFAEAILSQLLALNVHPNRGWQVSIAKPELFKSTRSLMKKGLEFSEKTRLSVMTEETNEAEWISYPKQTNSVFPIPLDFQDFAVWGEVVEELRSLISGKRLISSPDQMGGLGRAVSRRCP